MEVASSGELRDIVVGSTDCWKHWTCLHYVQHYLVCQASKQDYTVQPPPPPASSKVLKPHQRIEVDWAGPFIFLKSKWYVCVFVDMFSGFTAFYPTRTSSAIDFRLAFYNWISSNGVPESILSDNASVLWDVARSMGQGLRIVGLTGSDQLVEILPAYATTRAGKDVV